MLMFVAEMLNIASFICFGAALALVPVALAGGAAFGAASAKEKRRGRK